MDILDKKLTSNKQKKVQIVAEISEKVEKSKALVFTNYQGLTHQQIEGFKKGLRKLDAEYTITKNRLLKRALESNYKESVTNHEFNDPTATLFLYGDPVAPLKILAKMVKDTKKPEIKFGIMEGQMLDEKAVIRLSGLPPKQILLAQLMGMMNSPLAGLYRALNWNIQKFVMTLNAIEKQKQS